MIFRVSIKCECCLQRHTVYVVGGRAPPEKTKVKFRCPRFKDREQNTLATLPKGELALSIPENGIVGTLVI